MISSEYQKNKNMDLKNYQEYEELFNDDLVVAVRKALKKIENREIIDFEDSPEHNALIDYFNKFALHKKVNKSQFINWR